MIFIQTALYCEAKVFIDYFKLKRDNDVNKFQVFKNNDIILIIGGIGVSKSIISTTYLLTNFNADKNDIFLNVGVSGCLNKSIKKGTCFLCNKIINHDTKKTFYPDVLFKHPYRECTLETFSYVVNKDDCEVEGDIVDMEGSGVYQSASFFIPIHQVFIIKIVSDYLEEQIVDKKQIYKLIYENISSISDWIFKVQNFLNTHFKLDVFSDKEKYVIQKLKQGLKISVTMEYELRNLAWQYKGRNKNLEVLNKYLNIKCRDKKEGKKYFDIIKKELIKV